MSPSAPRTTALAPTSSRQRTAPGGGWTAAPWVAALALSAVACRPGGDAEPATTANAPAASVAAAAEAPDPKPAADAPVASADEGALANTAAPADEPPPEEAVADSAEAEAVADKPDEPKIPEEPYKVLLLGDSLAATGFGALLERKLDAHPHVVCYRKGKSASGLARPDFFDWMAEGKRQVEAREPDLVIVIMGGNDGQDLTKRRGSKRVHWQADEWADTYRERMDAFLAEISAPERKILWLGLPHMGLRSLEKKLVTIRQVQLEAVEALAPAATYVDTVPYTTKDDGATLDKAVVAGKKKAQKIRADDKIHFTMPGSQYFADRIYPDVLDVLALPDVEADTESKKD
ncbi:MAG: DUF459 domain-containing protein [Myxococcota bacterium]